MLSPSRRSRYNKTCKAGLSMILASCTLLTINGLGYAAYAKPSSTLVEAIVYLPVISYGAPPCSDIEDNDVPEQARPLVPLGQECAGSLQDDPLDEDDYYLVTLAQGQTLTVELSEMPVGADYDLVLYPLDSSKEVATSNQHGNVDERIVYTVPVDGADSYLIRLNIYEKSATATNSYVLRADIQ